MRYAISPQVLRVLFRAGNNPVFRKDGVDRGPGAPPKWWKSEPIHWWGFPNARHSPSNPRPDYRTKRTLRLGNQSAVRRCAPWAARAAAARPI